ncbi:hypothetical protein ACER0C_002379 [Sarotherodon galilaeus]
MLMFPLLLINSSFDCIFSQHASGMEVKVYDGVESVLLPCQLPADVSSDFLAAVWDREELKDPTVHVRLQSGDDFKNQNVRYTNRTSMRADALQTGDLSLTLRNPTISDSGTYTCNTRVTEPPAVWPIVLSAVLDPVVLLAAGFGVFMYHRYKMMKIYPVEMVNATQGEKSILLPFKVTDHLPQDVKVEWRLINPEDRMVYVYERSKNESPSRDHVYRGHAEMTEDPLTTKDLSLTLKDLCLTDSGVYTCTVYNKDGHMLLQKVVTLRYQTEMVEVMEGEGSVLIPFKITGDLPHDIKAEWRLTHPEEKMVHVYESGNNLSDEDTQEQVYSSRTEMNEDPVTTKDLSLTLKDLHLTDSGVYTCTVYNKYGYKLLQKSVTLSVRDRKSDIKSERRGGINLKIFS